MGRRKLAREELLELAGGGGGVALSAGAAGAAARLVDPHALHDAADVTSLQQTAGNKAATTAVQTLAVQRRGGAASTDAPGAKKKKSEPAQEDYAPTSKNEKFNHEENDALLERANQDANSNVKNTLHEAAERYEEYWFRTKNRAVGINLAKVYRKLGDDKRAAFWQGVATGSIKPGQKRVSDGSDQHA